MSFDLRTRLLQTVLIIPAILIAFTVHSYAQAFMADKLGDKKPRAEGRLTLNPIAHIDPFGFLMILLVQFGWGKPVNTNPRSYKNFYKDDLKVQLSGLASNLFTAILFTLVMLGFNKIYDQTFQLSTITASVGSIIWYILKFTIQINCMFGIINLIPIPGLDGFYIVRDLAPKFFYTNADKVYRYQLFILIAFIFPIFGGLSIADIIVGIPSSAIANLLISLT